MDREDVLHRIETDARLDSLSDALTPVARTVAGEGARKDALSGTWLGHPAHPMAVLAPLSCFFSASILDVVGGSAGRRAARRLIGLGILTSAPAAAAGLADWSDTTGAERRTGAVHAAANTVALGLYALSWRQRRRGATFRGVLSGLAGASALGVGGYLGGHLSYRQGVGVDATTFQAGPIDWRAVAALDDLPMQRPHAVTVDGVSLVLVRHDGGVSVAEARCPHRGGPLAEGTVTDGCITCPWHESRFDLRSGAVVDGPSTHPLPVYETRFVDGSVEVRRQEPSMLRGSHHSVVRAGQG
jgi:nitrite reductase/ring-hydroxylating ferredoxin subunit/uncharacterized membrane protein